MSVLFLLEVDPGQLGRESGIVRPEMHSCEQALTGLVEPPELRERDTGEVIQLSIASRIRADRRENFLPASFRKQRLNGGRIDLRTRRLRNAA